MSAYIVAKPHIDALVRVALEGPAGRPANRDAPWYSMRWYHNLESHNLRDDINRAGRMLWQENYKSVECRYPGCTDEDRPGPVGLKLEDIKAYTYPARQTVRHLTAVEALKALRCYEYQACEHPEWEASEASQFCDALRIDLIEALPGYDEAASTID